MASVEKFNASAVYNQIKHIERTIENPSNLDIDKEKINENYFLSPDRGMTSYDYYKQRISELYLLKRPDVNTLCGWVITAPKELKKEDEEIFFKSCYNFLTERYGEKNCISCAVHKDESGDTGHMHFLFTPSIETKKHPEGKISAKEVINQRELRNFHPDLQKHLDDDGLEVKVYTGITKKQGGNRTVKELKQEREEQRQVEQTKQINRWETQREEIKKSRW